MLYKSYCVIQPTIKALLERGMKPISFGEAELQTRLSKDGVLSKISALLNWNAFKPLLSDPYRSRTKDQGGERPYDSLSIFKAYWVNGAVYRILNCLV